MDDISSSLIVVGVTAVVVAAIFFFSHRTKEANQNAIREMAARKSWTYSPIAERLAWGSRLSGKNWELTARSEHVGQPSDSGSSNVQSGTVWKAGWVRPPDFTLLIGPRLSAGSTGNFLPPEFAGLRELDTGMTDLSTRYLLLGDSKADAEFLEISSIRKLLAEWPEKTRPLVKISPASLEITINGYQLDKPDDLERIVSLGEAFLSTLDH